MAEQNNNENDRRNETAGGIPPLVFPNISTPKQNLGDFTNKSIAEQRKHDILEEKHEAKIDKATYESTNIKNEFIGDKKAVCAERSEVIKAEYGSIGEYKNFQEAAKTLQNRDELIYTKSYLSHEKNTLVKNEFGNNANYKTACAVSDCAERRDNLISEKKDLLKQRNDVINAEYGGKAGFNEARKSADFKPSEKLAQIDGKTAALDGRIKSETAKISKLTERDDVSKLKASCTRKDFVENKNKLFEVSDRMKSVDKELASVSGQIKAESAKLNDFFSSRGADGMKACNTRGGFTKLQRDMLQKSERLTALEQRYSELGNKINSETSKIRMLGAEKNEIITGRNSLGAFRSTDKFKADSYKGKLKFAKQGGDKFEIKSARANYRLAKAQRNLPQERIIRRSYAFDEKSGKVKRKLKIEKEVKPINGRGGVVAGGVKKGTAALTAAAVIGVHRQISKYEEDNSALKALHGAEKVAEGSARLASRTAKTVNKKLRDAPYKRVSKLKFKSEKANAKLAFNKSLSANKEVIKSADAAKKAAQKSLRKKAQKLQQSLGSKVKEALTKLAKKIQELLLKNKYVVIGIIVILLLIVILSSMFGSFAMMFSESAGSLISSTYMSDDADMLEAEGYMSGLETALQTLISDIPSSCTGWDEYRFSIAEISHDPYALISYLSAKYVVFEYNSGIESDIDALFNALYTLQLTSIHETRTATYTGADGNPVTETYDYYILDVKLTKNDFDVAVSGLLTADQYELYVLVQATHGNRADLFP